MNETRLIIKALKKIMLSRGLRQYQLAAVLGVPASSLNRWMKGKHWISPAWMTLIKNNTEIGEELARHLDSFRE